MLRIVQAHDEIYPGNFVRILTQFRRSASKLSLHFEFRARAILNGTLEIENSPSIDRIAAASEPLYSNYRAGSRSIDDYVRISPRNCFRARTVCRV